MKYVTLKNQVYLTLVDAAAKHLEDIRSGIDGGVYEDSPENAEEIATIQAAIDYVPTVDEVPDDEEPMYTNYYKCPRCSCEWEDRWSSMCDDDCPDCGYRHISPYLSKDA